MYVEPDRPRTTIIEVALAGSDEDDSLAVPRRMTNEDVTIIQCRVTVDIVSTYSLQAIQYCAIRQYTSAQKDKWPLNGKDGSFIDSSDNITLHYSHLLDPPPSWTYNPLQYNNC